MKGAGGLVGIGLLAWQLKQGSHYGTIGDTRMVEEWG